MDELMFETFKKIEILNTKTLQSLSTLIDTQEQTLFYPIRNTPLKTIQKNIKLFLKNYNQNLTSNYSFRDIDSSSDLNQNQSIMSLNNIENKIENNSFVAQPLKIVGEGERDKIVYEISENSSNSSKSPNKLLKRFEKIQQTSAEKMKQELSRLNNKSNGEGEGIKFKFGPPKRKGGFGIRDVEDYNSMIKRERDGGENKDDQIYMEIERSHSLLKGIDSGSTTIFDSNGGGEDMHSNGIGSGDIKFKEGFLIGDRGGELKKRKVQRRGKSRKRSKSKNLIGSQKLISRYVATSKFSKIGKYPLLP